MEQKTRIWLGLGTAILVGSTGMQTVALGRESLGGEATAGRTGDATAARPMIVAQASEAAAGEGGPGEGGGAVLGTITEFRLSSNDPNAFAYDASAQVKGYTAVVHDAYGEAHRAAGALKEAVDALRQTPSAETLESARKAWLDARATYLRTEAFLFYAGPVDGPEGPFPRLNGWPVDPAAIDALIGDPAQSLNFRALARLNRVEPPVKVTVGLHVLEYLLWGADGAAMADVFAGAAGSRRAEYASSAAQLLLNDMTLLNAAWATGTNNYRASVEAMDQRNALGRAFNGMTVLVGYEIPLRRIGAALFPANRDFQPSPFSKTSEVDNVQSFEGAKAVYFGSGLDKLVTATDAGLAAKIATGFDRAGATLAAMNAPYDRFLAPASGSPERAAAEAAARALTDLARDLRQAGNRLGVLVVVPGM